VKLRAWTCQKIAESFADQLQMYLVMEAGRRNNLCEDIVWQCLHASRPLLPMSLFDIAKSECRMYRVPKSYRDCKSAMAVRLSLARLGGHFMKSSQANPENAPAVQRPFHPVSPAAWQWACKDVVPYTQPWGKTGDGIMSTVTYTKDLRAFDTQS